MAMDTNPENMESDDEDDRIRFDDGEATEKNIKAINVGGPKKIIE